MKFAHCVQSPFADDTIVAIVSFETDNKLYADEPYALRRTSEAVDAWLADHPNVAEYTLGNASIGDVASFEMDLTEYLQDAKFDVRVYFAAIDWEFNTILEGRSET